MIEQLKELLIMQQMLDNNILKEKRINNYPVEDMKIALLVELGELLNEFPTKFKHWKSSAKDNREKGLIEYVDCLHFALSLANYYEIDVEEDKGVNNPFDYHKFNDCMKFNNKLLEEIYLNDMYRLSFLFDLGKVLGFRWEEVYNTYKKKNKVNYERLKEGY